MFDHPTDLADLDARVLVTPLPPGDPTHAVLGHADATDGDDRTLAVLDTLAGELLADAMAALGSISPAAAGD